MDDEESEESDIKQRKKNKKDEAKKKEISGKWKKGDKNKEDLLEDDAEVVLQQDKKGAHGRARGENHHIAKPVVDMSNKIKEFCTEEYGIFERGSYVRIDIKKIKRKYVDHFNVNYPLVLCTTNLQESNFGFLKVRFNKHIFHPKILKNNDPIIFSMGID